MNSENTQYIFGPVPSRRLGRSLGIDFVPFKTCSYDCIYCQLGRTINKTIERREWFPMDSILSQLKDKLSTQPDYITLSGSGEPTLYSRCGELIDCIKQITNIPVAILTNGSLLWMPEVRESLSKADLVIPSLDAGSDTLFRYMNRPHPDISFEKMLNGLISFRKDYSGPYWLEVFLAAGLSTTDKELDKLKTAIGFIQPDRVQINTVMRPPAEPFVEPVPVSQLKQIALRLFRDSEVIADYRAAREHHEGGAQQEDILTLLTRRPCTIEDITNGFAMHRNEAVKYIQALLSQKRITLTSGYYRPLTPPSQSPPSPFADPVRHRPR